MNLFPAPVSGQPIPRGWFARLVRFMNTLILHGDGSYTQVKHTDDGTFVTLTPAAIDALNRASGRPGGGANQDLSVSVSGNIATVSISGSTSAVEFVGTGAVTLTGNTNGQVEIGASGGTASAAGFPNFGAELVTEGSMVYNTTYGPFAQNAYLIGEVTSVIDGQQRGNLSVYLSGGTIAKTVHLFDVYRDNPSSSDILGVPVYLPIPAGVSFQLLAVTDEANIVNLAVYPAL